MILPSVHGGRLIMDERRRKKRTDLDAHLTIKKLDGSNIEEHGIDVVDISISGIGFKCADELELGSVYEGTLTIWTKEKIKVFLDIVRRDGKENGFHYGADFVGLPDLYKRKIGIYQVVEEETHKQSE